MTTPITDIASGPHRIAGGRGTPEQVLASIVDGINTGNLDALMSLYESRAAFATPMTLYPGTTFSLPR